MFCAKLLVDAVHHRFHVRGWVCSLALVKFVAVFSVVAHECDSSVVECGSVLGASRDLVSASADVLIAVDCICFIRLVFGCRN